MRRLLGLLDEGIPVLALVRSGGFLAHDYHYVVVTGYDDTNGRVLVQDGIDTDRVESYDSFQDAWHQAAHWVLIVFPPEQTFSFLTADDHLEMAALCEERGTLEQAMSHYEAVLVSRPRDQGALLGLAGCSGRLGRAVEAQAYFEKALEVAPEDPRVLNNYALHILKSGGDLAGAEAMALRALARAPELAAYIRDTIGQILGARGDVAGARASFEAALAVTQAGDEQLREEIHRHLAALDRR